MEETSKNIRISGKAYKNWLIVAKKLEDKLKTKVTVPKAIEIIGGEKAEEKNA